MPGFRSTRLRIVRVGPVLLGAILLLGTSAGCKKKSPTAPSPQPTVTGPVVNTANPNGSAANWEARTSMRTPNTGTGFQLFDDFGPTTSTTITKVSWQGIYCVESPNLPPPAPTAQSFVVGFYGESSNYPNQASPLSVSTYPLARVAETVDQQPISGNCGTTATGISLYNYTVTLDTPFAVTAGSRYWFSVMAVVDYTQQGNPSFVFWGWRNGVVNNNRSVLVDPSGNFTTYALDRAYTLTP
jgi:hypothetical protein